MVRDTAESTFDEDDIGTPVHDAESGDEIGTIADYDEDRVYVEPSEDVDEERHEQLDALGWRAPDGSFEIDTDAIEGLPDQAEGDHGVDLSGYDEPDDSDSGDAAR